MSENNPYLIDIFLCSVCEKNEAKYECPQCQIFLCPSCVTRRKGFWRCPKCGGRLYPTEETRKRFVGSTAEMPKFHGATMKKVPEAPKIYPKADRKRIREQNSNA